MVQKEKKKEEKKERKINILDGENSAKHNK